MEHVDKNTERLKPEPLRTIRRATYRSLFSLWSSPRSFTSIIPTKSQHCTMRQAGLDPVYRCEH